MIVESLLDARWRMMLLWLLGVTWRAHPLAVEGLAVHPPHLRGQA